MKHELEARHESKNQEEGMRKRLEFTCFPVVSKSAITCFPRSLFYFYCYCLLSLKCESSYRLYESMKWEGEENRVKTEGIFARIFGRTKHSFFLNSLIAVLFFYFFTTLLLHHESWREKRSLKGSLALSLESQQKGRRKRKHSFIPMTTTTTTSKE